MATRLSIMEPQSFTDRIKYNVLTFAFGFFPDVMRITFAKTKLNIANTFQKVLKTFHRPSPSWSKAEAELFASFVSSQNDCEF